MTGHICYYKCLHAIFSVKTGVFISFEMSFLIFVNLVVYVYLMLKCVSLEFTEAIIR